jgi:hypothetical protein
MKAGAVAAATTTLRFFPTRKNKEREVTLALKKLLRHQTDKDRQTVVSCRFAPIINRTAKCTTWALNHSHNCCFEQGITNTLALPIDKMSYI